jgi:hypothetical protein
MNYIEMLFTKGTMTRGRYYKDSGKKYRYHKRLAHRAKKRGFDIVYRVTHSTRSESRRGPWLPFLDI